MKQVIGKDGKSTVVPLSAEDIAVADADVLREASRDFVAERQAAIDAALEANEPLSLILEWIAEQVGKNKGQAVAEIKGKVK